MRTIHDLADCVLSARQRAWDKTDPRMAIVTTEHLGPDDERAVRRVVAAAGFRGDDLDRMSRLVAERVVGKVQGLIDAQPAIGAD